MWTATAGASFPSIVLIGSLLIMRELMALSTRPPGPKTRFPWMSWEIDCRISSRVATMPFFHSAVIWE